MSKYAKALYGAEIVFVVDGKEYVIESLHQTIEPNVLVVVKLKDRPEIE